MPQACPPALFCLILNRVSPVCPWLLHVHTRLPRTVGLEPKNSLCMKYFCARRAEPLADRVWTPAELQFLPSAEDKKVLSHSQAGQVLILTISKCFGLKLLEILSRLQAHKAGRGCFYCACRAAQYSSCCLCFVMDSGSLRVNCQTLSNSQSLQPAFGSRKLLVQSDWSSILVTFLTLLACDWVIISRLLVHEAQPWKWNWTKTADLQVCSKWCCGLGSFDIDRFLAWTFPFELHSRNGRLFACCTFKVLKIRNCQFL